jgi:DNA-binding NarL/FixJ family response regulator
MTTLKNDSLAPKPRIILADDHRTMLEELSRLLEREFEIVAAVTDGALAVERVADLKPDAILLDINMPGMGGIEAAQHLRRLGSPTKIIFLTIETDPDYVRLATAMSASYVVKSRMRRDLLIAIRDALAGRLFVSST